MQIGKKIQVKIGSMVYQLSADKDQQYIIETAEIADDLITKVIKRYPSINPSAAQVLALVNSVDLMRQSQADLEGALAEKILAEQNENEIKAELARLREQFWELKKDLLHYKNLCDIHEQRLAEIAQAQSDKSRAPVTRKVRAIGPTSLDERQTCLDDLASAGSEKGKS